MSASAFRAELQRVADALTSTFPAEELRPDEPTGWKNPEYRLTIGAMKRTLNWSLACLAVLALAGPAAARADPKAGCDRACLTHVLDRYLQHVLARRPDPSLLAAHPNIRENTLAVALDRGVWRSLVRKRAGWIFADPEAGQIAFAGVFDDRAGGLTPLFVRLKVEHGRVAESEVAFNNGPSPFFHPEALLEPDVLYDAPVPPNRRSSREALVRVAGLYLDGIAARSGAKVPIGDRCDKYYLGGKVTNAGVPGIGTCRESFDGVKADAPVGRRFPIVDVERGIVVVSFLMPQHYKDPPDSTYECEILKVVDGKIRQVEEFGNTAAYLAHSGFGP